MLAVGITVLTNTVVEESQDMVHFVLFSQRLVIRVQRLNDNFEKHFYFTLSSYFGLRGSGKREKAH